MNDLGAELLRYKKDQAYLTKDYETLNLNLAIKEVNLPWQLGWIRHKGTKLISENEDWIDIGDNPPISREAAAMTHFNLGTYLNKKQSAKKVREDYEKYLYDENYIVITANGWNFDLDIDTLFRKFVGKAPDYSWINRLVCVQNLHKALELQVKLPKIGTNEWVSFNYKLARLKKKGLKTNLKFLSEYYGLEYREDLHHISALWDVQQTKAIFDKQLFKIEI